MNELQRRLENATNELEKKDAEIKSKDDTIATVHKQVKEVQNKNEELSCKIDAANALQTDYNHLISQQKVNAETLSSVGILSRLICTLVYFR